MQNLLSYKVQGSRRLYSNPSCHNARFRTRMAVIPLLVVLVRRKEVVEAKKIRRRAAAWLNATP